MSARAIDVLNGSPRQEDVSSTLLECDLVMKGGITSGVVYPKAVVRIARDYRIRNVGGTSVGAIAAALTTAAEYYRQTNPKADAAQWDDLRAKMDHDLQPSAINADAPEHEGHVDVDAPGFSGMWAIPREIGRDLQGKLQP